MRILLSAVAVALLWVAPLAGQVSVSESGIDAHPLNGVTAVSLPVRNESPVALQAQITLKWVDPKDNLDQIATQQSVLPPGDSVFDIPLPISAKMKPLQDRLVYEVAPFYPDLAKFNKITGVVSLPNISQHAFILRVVSLGVAKPDAPFDIRIVTAHPVTGKPISGVALTWGEKKALSDGNGFAAFRVLLAEEKSLLDTEIHAKLGDFEQAASAGQVSFMQPQLSIQLDKPIYQAGQIMHIRILSFAANGQAAARQEYRVSVTKDAGDVEYETKLRTSDWGIASSDWAIPISVDKGRYVISVENDGGDFAARRDVTIRGYELPSFRVKAHGVRSYYLLKQRATIEVSAEYLFGKPVAGGTVRIVNGEDEHGEIFARGKLNAQGVFRASFPVNADLSGSQRYLDRHFVAFVTDAGTNRTEQKKFDLRISRDSLHIYLVKEESTLLGRRAFFTVYAPDGAPVEAGLTAWQNAKPVAQARSNRYGVARLDIGNVEDEIRIEAKCADGRHAEIKQMIYRDSEDDLGLWLETEHAIYAPGAAIRGDIVSTRQEAVAQLIGWNKKQEVVYARALRLSNGKSHFEIPYAKEFGREFQLAALVGPERIALRTIIFPGPDELQIHAVPAQRVYKPGESARLELTATLPSALGIAVVDQSVFERAAADAAFGRRTWFHDYQSESIGGVTYDDLLHLDPRKIDSAVDLLAELLRGDPWIRDEFENALQDAQNAFSASASNKLAAFRSRLDEAYLKELAYPTDELSLAHLAIGIPLDPWLQPFHVRFSVVNTGNFMQLCSDGPDKKPATGDDFCVLSVNRKWFARQESIIRDSLASLEAFPTSSDLALAAIEKAGLHFDALRDPWRSALRLKLSFQRDESVISIWSAGPDKRFDTNDDVLVCQFRGNYFRPFGLKIQSRIDDAKTFPSTQPEFFRLAKFAGVDFNKITDPWGRRYSIKFHSDLSYFDKVSFYTYAEYGRPPETRKQLTPGRHAILVADVMSTGPNDKNRVSGGFVVYTFRRIVDEPLPKPAKPDLPTNQSKIVQGRGTVAGLVTDIAGTAVPGATVRLNRVLETKTDSTGRYSFADLSPGAYVLTFEAAGFQSAETINVPIRDGVVTQYNLSLRVGAAAETVEVNAEAPVLETTSANIIETKSVSAVATPRIREYFPETAYWLPELITDSSGHASLDFKLADSITAWHVAVIASTKDGNVSETETEVRAFQPFQVDLDLPPILTAGDRLALPVPVRNYSDQSQQVSLNAQAEQGLSLGSAPLKPLTVLKNAAANGVLHLTAGSVSEKARLQVGAIGSAASDAIAKTTQIHPDGERKEKSVANILQNGQTLNFELPAAALPGSVKAELKIYPSVLARLLESVEAVLETPYGCGEQTVSSSYPNLLVLQALKSAGMHDERIETRARKNLELGYRRLLGYQSSQGGFEYWHGRDPDPALTAYALEFLRDLKEFQQVDESRMKNATDWLRTQALHQPNLHVYSIRALVDAGADAAVLNALTRLAVQANLDDPYQLAVFADAAIDARKPELAESAIRRLAAMAQDEQGAAFWALRANTPFYGWGRTGEIETTSLAISALAKWQSLPGVAQPGGLASLVNRGVLFLLRNTNRSGIWGSGQATVRALKALAQVAGQVSAEQTPVAILVNGKVVGNLTVSQTREVDGPIRLDIAQALSAGANQVSLQSASNSLLQIQVAAVWYEKWNGSRQNEDFSLSARFSAINAKINQAVKCSVTVSRPRFRGYGMMIAQIGLPPGAEVDRGSLEAALDQVDSYEVAPDRVTFYLWPKAQDVKFDFLFRPRFAMQAKMAESVLYDYYNPGARAILEPPVFTVH